MPRLHGIAAAFHGKDHPKLTASAIAGESKEDLHVTETWSQPVDPRSLESLRAGFGKLLAMAVGVARLQHQSVPGVPAPMTFGCPAKFPMVAMERQLRQAFASVMQSEATRTFRKRKQRHRAKTGTVQLELPDAEEVSTFEEIWAAILRTGMIVQRHLARNAGPAANAVRFQPRSFELRDGGMGGDTLLERMLVDGPSMLENDLRLLGLKQRAEAGDAEAMGELEHEARMRARAMVVQFRLDAATRFIQTGERKPPYTTSAMYTFLSWFHLRQVCAGQLIGNMTNKHNICIKTPADEGSPPFVDVTGTYMGDQFDELTGTQPTAVLVRGSGPLS